MISLPLSRIIPISTAFAPLALWLSDIKGSVKNTFPELLGALEPPSIKTLPVPFARKIKSSLVFMFSITLSLILTLLSTTSPPLEIITFG